MNDPVVSDPTGMAVELPAGSLTLVATPIGNLGDITLRALAVLRAADLVASEDTRHTGRLLARFNVRTRQIAFHEHNEESSCRRLLGLLAEGRRVALVSDAGTPGISDPGFRLVRAALAAGHPISMAPGPTSPVMAVVLSGLPCHSFTFRGFPPRRASARRRWLALETGSPHTQVLFESVYRIQDLIADCLAVYGDRPAAVANDLTKLHEAVLRGTLSDLERRLAEGKLAGEYVLIVAGREGSQAEELASDDRPDEARG